MGIKFRKAHARTAVVVAAVMTLLAILALPAHATVGSSAGFEDADGNLASATLTDWNSFSPSWTGTDPYQTAATTASGWKFGGFQDAAASTTDSAFNGGTKQDDNCASVGTQKADNKADLKRIYLGSKTVSGHTYLMLAWVRIPQNTTSASAHVAFEFNRGTTACGAGHDSLVQRSANSLGSTGNNADMLIVYDFEGGTSTPSLKLERWVTSGTCEVSSDNPPCWGTATTLSASVGEAAVDTGVNGFPSTATDAIAPGGSETLGTDEFGEAGIDLTAAGVFAAGTCVTFGKAFGVSRTSGNSAQAQMKDLVGPGPFSLTNCGSIQIVKQDAGTNNLAGAKFKIYKDDGDNVYEPGTGDTQTGSECTTTSDGTGDCTFSNLVIGDKYWVTETQPPAGYTLPTPDHQLVTIVEGTTTVTFHDPPAIGSLKIVKKDDTNNLIGGIVFTLKGTSTTGVSVDSGCTTSSTVGTTFGTCTISNVPVGTYTLDETVPSGYAKDANLPKSVTVVGGTTTTINVANPRLHRVIVIVCHEGTDTLYSSSNNVTFNGSTKTSISAVPSPLASMGVTQKDLCTLGGAQFNDLGHTPGSPSPSPYAASVSVPGH